MTTAVQPFDPIRAALASALTTARITHSAGRGGNDWYAQVTGTAIMTLAAWRGGPGRASKLAWPAPYQGANPHRAPVVRTGPDKPVGPDTSDTHEAFIAAVRAVAVKRLTDPEQRRKVLGAKLVYGVGSVSSARGATYYEAWQNGSRHDFIEVMAQGEQSAVQLAGTTVHECAHVLAGRGSGHGSEWKVACRALGLRRCTAAGQAYTPNDFEPALWSQIEALPAPNDGTPVFQGAASGGSPLPYVGLPGITVPRPCPLGYGTRGGRSRGAGSGSRYRLYACGCEPAVKVRAATDDLDATCNVCKSTFARVHAQQGGEA